MSKISEILDQYAQIEGLQIPSLSDTQKAQFEKYYQILIKWNEVMNLTAVTDEEGAAVKHFADSLTIGKYFPGNIQKPDNQSLEHTQSLDKNLASNIKTLIDVGTGAGFPGLPIKIAYPDIEVTLLDSLGKRVNFLNEVIAELGLKGIVAIHARAEDGGHDAKLRGHFDVSVARAVAPMNILSEYCMPFLKQGGSFIAMKGPNEEANFQNAVKALGGKVDLDEIFTLPMANPTDEPLTRRIIRVTQVSPCPGKFPRKAGTPQKQPL